MALKDKIAFGISLPHRSPDPIDMADVQQVATAGRGARLSRSVGHREHARPRQLLRPGRDPDLCGGGDDKDPGRLLGRRVADPQPADGRASMGAASIMSATGARSSGSASAASTITGSSRCRSRAGSAASARRWRSSRRCGPRTRSPIDGRFYHLEGRDDVRRSRCRSRTRRSGWGSATRTRCAAPRVSPTAGWGRAARASPISPPRCRS